jgi:MFS transporter, FHS family, L-fucose permease
MITPTNSNPSGTKPASLFCTPDGKSYLITFVLVTSLFLLWGFCNGMIDILNKHFQDSLHINKEQSGLVQFANYLGYFLMAIPAGLIARQFGYKGGILVGLALIASGAFLFIHAVGIGTYSAFLLGLFVIAAGMTCLETIANPYTTVLGPPEHGATRINIAQTFNGVGWVLGPIVGGYFVFGGGGGGSSDATGAAASATNAVVAATTNANTGLSTPYLGIGIFAAVWFLVFIFAPVPDLHAEDESKKSADQKPSLNFSIGQLLAIGALQAVVYWVLYSFITKMLGVVWIWRELSPAWFEPAKYSVLLAAYVAGLLLVSKINTSRGQLVGIGLTLAIVWGLLYFFIAPIMGLVWALLNLPANLLGPTKYGLIIVAYIGSFIVVSKNWDMFRRKHFTLGVVAQFLYVAAQTGIFSFCVNYIIENDAGVTPAKAATMLGGIGFVLFTVGRFCGSAVISQFKPHLVLAAYAAINVVLAAVCMGGGKLGLIALFGTFFFMSVMFPTIFALGIRGLGDYTKLGASLIVMSIVGGAIAPPFMGHIADVHSMRTGMVVPLVCFVAIAIYGMLWQKLELQDSRAGKS